jgi:uncharacterized membrane protein
MMLLVGVVAVAVLGALGWWFSTSITRPLARLNCGSALNNDPSWGWIGVQN